MAKKPDAPEAEKPPVEQKAPEAPQAPVVDLAAEQAAAEAEAAAKAASEADEAEKARAAEAAAIAQAAEANASAGLALAESDDSVPANAAELQWPTDRDGITAELKRALLDAAGRVNGREDKLNAIMAVLSLGAKHILARYAVQVETNAESLDWHEKQNAARRAIRRDIGWQS